LSRRPRGRYVLTSIVPARVVFVVTYFLCQTKSKKLHVILCAELHHYDSNHTLLLFYTVRAEPLSKQYNKHSKLLEPSVRATCYICITY